MKIDDLYFLTLEEVLRDYCAVISLECCYWYGIFKCEDIEKLFGEYNIDDNCYESFSVEPLISDELLLDSELGDYGKLERIMSNLGISKKD